MANASQTTENGQAAKKSRWTRKRIDLITLTFLLITGILLMPVKVSQKEAKEAEPITATASAITLGRFLAVASATWLIERGLDAATKDKLDDNGGVTLPTGNGAIEARALVSGAYWIGNFYTRTHKEEE